MMQTNLLVSSTTLYRAPKLDISLEARILEQAQKASLEQLERDATG